MVLKIFHIHAIIYARRMDHGPATEAHTNMRDMAVIITFSEEEQIPNFKWWLNRFCSRMLHIRITRDLNPDPAMKQVSKTRTIDPIAA
jgi:hypothetical protein